MADAHPPVYAVEIKRRPRWDGAGNPHTHMAGDLRWIREPFGFPQIHQPSECEGRCVNAPLPYPCSHSTTPYSIRNDRSAAIVARGSFFTTTNSGRRSSGSA